MGISTQRVRLMDAELEPLKVLRGKVQDIRWYRREILEIKLASNTIWRERKPIVVRPPKLPKPERMCACDCGETTLQQRKYVVGHLRRRVVERIIPPKREPVGTDKRWAKDRYYQYNYGVRLDWVLRLFASQGYVCACCGRDKPYGATGWNLEHDHDTDQIRGVTCNVCNNFISQAQDPVNKTRDNLQALEVAYLNAKTYLLSVEARMSRVKEHEEADVSIAHAEQQMNQVSSAANVEITRRRSSRDRRVLPDRVPEVVGMPTRVQVMEHLTSGLNWWKISEIYSVSPSMLRKYYGDLGQLLNNPL